MGEWDYKTSQMFWLSIVKRIYGGNEKISKFVQ